MTEQTPNLPTPAAMQRGLSVGPRYGQLIYTSFDNGSGVGGGWQVKAESGGLTAPERETLTARIVTTFDLDPALKEFPTTDEIAQRPARLAYAALDPASAAYWHTVDAGKDATGRPGNVLAHVVLDRRTADPSALRPIQLWNSPDWLRPYGPPEVLATNLIGDEIPAPNPTITAADTVKFLTDTTIDRQGIFRVLLDALYAALAGGPTVMLVTEGHKSGPKWIAGLSFFMSPGTARRFNWSTHDKPELAASDARRGVHLIVVPRASANALPPGDWVVIDEKDDPALGELGSVHTTATGAVTVTAWSTLAEGVLGGEGLAMRVLARQDVIAAEVGDVDLSRQWPLAVAVRGEPELNEFHGVADQVVADDAPLRVASVAWLDAVVAAAGAATAPATAADALERLTEAVARGVGVARAARQLLHTALRDPTWLRSGSLGLVPRVTAAGLDEIAPAIGQRIEALRAGLPDSSGQTVQSAMQLAELLVRLSVRDEHLQDAFEQIVAVVRDAGVEFLWQDSAVAILVNTGDISAETREAILRKVVAEQPVAALTQIGVTTWRWLYGDENASPDQVGALSPNPYKLDFGLYPRYVLALLAEKTAVTASRTTTLVTDAVGLALEAQRITDDECRSLITELDRCAPLTGESLIGMFTSWPERISPSVTIDDMYYRAAPRELVDVIARYPTADMRIDIDTDARCAVAGARLRTLYNAPGPLHPDVLNNALLDELPILLENVPLSRVNDLADEFGRVLGALVIVAQSRSGPTAYLDDALVAALRGRLERDNDAVVTLVVEMAGAGVVDVGWIVGQSLLTRINPQWGAQTVLSDRVDGSQRDGWAGEVALGIIERGAYRGPEDVVALRDSAWPQVRTLNPDAAEEFFARYPKAARDWLHDYRIGESDGHRLGFRRRN